MADQILKPRTGYKGLTNLACDKIDEKGGCLTLIVKEYLLDDQMFRTEANDFHFICNIGGRRYKICRDQPGFCHTWYEKRFILKDIKHVDFLPVTNYQYLIDANTRCFSSERYPFVE